jgi:hypothetical protein
MGGKCMAFIDDINAVRNRYDARKSYFTNKIKSYYEKDEEEDDEYNKWKKNLDNKLKADEKKEEKKLNAKNTTDKFNVLENMAKMNPVGKKSESKAKQSIMFNDWDKASNTNSFLRNAEQKYDDKTLIDKAEKANRKKLSDKQKQAILNKDYKERSELEKGYEDTIDTRKKYNDVYTSNIVNGKKVDERDLFYKNITGLDIEKSPLLMKARMNLTKFGQSGASAMVGDEKIYDKRLDSKNKISDAAVKMAGMTAGMLYNPGGSGGIGKVGTEVEKLVSYAGNKFLPNLANKIPNVVSKIGGSALTGAADMGAYGTLQQEGKKLNGEKITTGEELKNIGRESLYGAAFGAGLSGLGMSVKGIFPKIFNKSEAGNTIIKPIEQEAKLTSEQITKPKGISKSKYKSALEYHNAMFDEYKNAENVWEDAVNNIQNRFGQKELTVPEQNLIKSEMGIDIEKLANNYDNAYNNFNQAKEALNKSISRQQAKSSNIANKYGLEQDISGLSELEQKSAYKKSLLNVLEDSGLAIKNKLKNDNPYDVVKHYENKYNLKPIQVVKSNTTNTNPAKIFINKDKAGNVIGARLEINDSYSRNQQLGALRHEIEHLKDVQEGFTPTESIGNVKNVKTLEEFYNQSSKGHHKNYDSFDLEYLKNNYNQNVSNNPIVNKSGDIKIQPADSSNRYNIGYNDNVLDMPIINKKFKPQDINTDTQFMTDTSNAPIKDKISKVKNTMSRLFTDRYVDVKPISKQANELLNLENQSNGTIDYILNKKLVNKEGDAITNKSFKDVLTMGDDKLQKQYEDYLLNKHNIDRYKEGKTLLANSEGVEITPEQSQQIISQYDQTYPQFRELANQYSANWNSFSNEWLSDFVNKDTMKMLQEKYPSYVPSYRQQESFSTQLPTNRIVNGAKIKEATGSTKKIIPLNEQISEQISKIVKANRRNEAYKEMLKPVLENPEKFADKIEIVKIGTDKYANVAEREVAQQVLSMQDDVIAGEDSINNLIDIINNPVKQVQGRDGYLTVFDKGTPITVKIKDQNLFNALNKSQQTSNLSFLGKAWNKYVLTPFKGAITQYNPFFAVRNVARDLPSAYIQGAENNPIKFIGGRAKSVADLTKDFFGLKNDPLWDKYQALGGEMMNISSNPLAPNKIRGKVFDKASFIPRKYSDLLGISEQFNRFAEFKKVFKETGDTNKAKIAAANVTVNFGKGGELIKAIDKVIPYSNAAVQGTLKTIETFKDKPIQAIGKAILSTTIPAAGFYYYNNSNKERQKIYDEITNDVKNTNYVMVINKDTIIKIPKTQQAGLLFASLGERLYDYFGKNDKEAFKGMPESLKKSFMPIDYKSGVVMPAINVAMGGNKDFFGRDIVPQSLENMSPEQQYDEKTTTLSKYLGQQFGLSPKKVDYLLDSYAGVIYDIMKKSGDSKAKGGIISKGIAGITDTAKANFTINTDYGKTTSSYYDLINKYKTDKADFNKSIAKKKAKALSDTGSKTMQSSSAKEYLNSILTDDEYEKSQKFNELNKIINKQSEELQGLSTKDKKNRIKEFFKALEEYKKERDDLYGSR